MGLGFGFTVRIECNYINRGVHRVRVLVRIRVIVLRD